MSEQIDVVTIGESIVLFQPMMEGPLTYCHLFSKSIAGAESNVAIALSRLGKKVRWISRVGNDPFGQTIISTLAGEGVDVSHVIKDEHAPTGIYFKEFKQYGEPNIYYYRKFSAASNFSKKDIKSEWLDHARHLHVTGITSALGEHTVEFMKEVMKLAKEKGLTVSFDPNLRYKLWDNEKKAKEVINSLISLSDVFLPGIEEAKFLTGMEDYEKNAQRFLEMGPKLVVIKLGQKGSVAFFGKKKVVAEAVTVENVVDPIGAGDAFAAGFLSVLLNENNPLDETVLDKQIEDALKHANLLGALATQFKGDWESSPYAVEVNRLLLEKEPHTR